MENEGVFIFQIILLGEGGGLYDIALCQKEGRGGHLLTKKCTRCGKHVTFIVYHGFKIADEYDKGWTVALCMEHLRKWMVENFKNPRTPEIGFLLNLDDWM